MWRKPEGVEPSLPAKREATGFEDREGHRAPLASSIAIWSERASGMVQAGLGGAGRPDVCALAIEQPDFRCAWTLRRFFNLELDALAFSKQFEHRAANRRAMEEVFDAALVPNEPEAFVDQQSCNRAAGHD